VNPLPGWHQPNWQRLQECREADRFPHALLLHGPDGLGKSLFAEQLARSLLCTDPDATGMPCEKCHACQMCSAGSHPDLHRVEPEEKGRAIRIDAVRALCSQLALKSQFGGYKVALLAPADNMNIAASNALLKTLEEPPSATLLILVTARPARLTATIRSRCQSLAFAPPDREAALAWLRDHRMENASEALDAANGAPFLAERLSRDDGLVLRQELLKALVDIHSGHTDSVTYAANYAKQDANAVCGWMLSYVTDMIRLKSAAHPPQISNVDSRELLERLGQNLTLDRLFSLLDTIAAAARLPDTSINTQLLMEELFMQWLPDRANLAGRR
jgi:DNA polymerase-3 subunit delta'